MTTWNDQIQASLEDVSMWRWIFRSLSRHLTHSYQLNSSTITIPFKRETSWNSFEVIWRTRTCIFKWSPRSCCGSNFVSFLMPGSTSGQMNYILWSDWLLERRKIWSESCPLGISCGAMYTIGHFQKYHNTLCLSLKSLHKHCLCLLLGPL